MAACCELFCTPSSSTYNSCDKPTSTSISPSHANPSYLSSPRLSQAKTPSLHALFSSAANPYHLVRPHRKGTAFVSRLRASSGNLDGGYSPQAADNTEEEAQAREAVVTELQESGVSLEDARAISLNCPNYIAKLVGSVRELDDLSLWSSWRNNCDNEVLGGERRESSDNYLTFNNKVRLIVKQKGNNVILPFLESIGLGSSAIMRVASYLASESLPDLIERVNFLKRTFLYDSGEEMLIGRSARRMMILLSISVNDEIEQTLSFFEKMEARRGGLEMLGLTNFCFACLIDSFPRLLLCSIEDNFIPLCTFFNQIGVQREKMKKIVLLFPPVFFYDIERDIKPGFHLLSKAGVEMKDYSQMLFKYPWLLCQSIQNNYEEILSFFEIEKVPKLCVDRAIKSWPHLLGCSTSKMKVMVKQLSELGIRNKMLASILTSSPQLMLRKPKEFLEVVRFLEEIGFDEHSVGRILQRCPEIFASDIEGTLQKKISLLINFGISPRWLPRVIKKYPELLVSDVCNTLLPRMEYLMKMGFSRREVSSMVHRFSPILGYSIDVVLKPKIDFLRIMEKPLAEVVEYPRYFSYSLEKKIKPRYLLLKSRDIKCSLKEMLGRNDEEFAEDYMGIERIFILPPVRNG